MNRVLRCGITLFVLVGLSGCGRYFDWGLDKFYQGTDVAPITLPPGALQSVIVYHQLSTRGDFDVIWLSDQVRKAYTDVHAQKNGKNEQQANAFYRRQLEENKHFISFYILAPTKFALSDPNNPWSIFLLIGDTMYPSMEIKKTVLVPEYEHFFGKKMTIHKAAYQIKFDAKDVEENALITPDLKTISLLFRSIDKSVQLTWNV
jgi:hypothetical protein